MLLNVAMSAAVFSTGALSSIGPCVAPRFIAVAGLTAGRRIGDALLNTTAFVLGLATLYASLGAAAAVVLHDAAFSTAAYYGMAAVLGVSGILQLCRQPACDHRTPESRARGVGGAFLLGASSGISISPCCAPVVGAIASFAGAGGDPAGGALLLICYASGHSLPLFMAAVGAGGVNAVIARHSLRSAASLLAATLMLALCAYYAVLA